jgi:hypothetical protein
MSRHKIPESSPKTGPNIAPRAKVSTEPGRKSKVANA